MEKDIFRKIYLIISKCNLIVRLCEQKRIEEAFAGVGDFTGAITGLLTDITAAGDTELAALFGRREFLEPLQTIMMSMQSRELAVLSDAMLKGMIPFMNKALEIVRKNSGIGSDELYSTEEAKEWADAVEYDGMPRAVCMFGYADGKCAAAFDQRLSDGSILIAFEPGKENIIDFREELQKNIDYYRTESLIIVEHPLYKDIFLQEYAAFIHAINDNRTRVMVNRNTLARFREDAPRNVITNLPMMEHANLVNELGRIIPRDIPVIIVSAGPSLDKNIEELRRAKGHSLIFAVDTAMKYLLARDIIPDLAITIEPIKPMANYEDERCFAVPHVFDNESNPEIVSRHKARKFIYNCRDYVKRLLESLGIEVPKDSPSGGSVATAAFAICYQLQMKRIILIGQDLAYEGTSTHAGGVESKGINNDIGYEMIEGINGEKVRSRSDWLGYLQWFENAIALMKDEGYDMEVIDATEDGALIHGSRVMTLADAIDEYCVREYDFAKELEILPYLLDEKEWSRFGEQVKESGRELELVKDAAGKAIKLCQEVLDEDDTKDENRLKEVRIQLAGFRKTCEDAMLYPLINNYAVTEIADEVSRLRLEDSGPVSEIRQQKLAFEAIEGACGYFRKVMGERIG